jgi:methionyl-tRNA formyltransferase
VAVVTQPDRAAGRGKKLEPPPVKKEALKADLPVLQPISIRKTEFLDTLRKLAPYFIVVVAYGKILPREIIHLPPGGCINIHASLLPKYRGAAPINRAIIKGEEKTGITSMFMDEGLDTGPILIKKEIGITENDTAGAIEKKLSELSSPILISTLDGLRKGTIKADPQKGEATYAHPLKKEDCLIPWSSSARDISNLIRGLTPRPGAYTFLGNKRIRVNFSRTLEGEAQPGVVCKVTKKELLVGTGSGIVSIVELQPPGKSSMPISAFLQGRKIKEGMFFTSNPS